MVNLVTFYNDRIRFVIMGSSNKLKSSRLTIYIFNDNFYFIAYLNKNSLYCNSFSNDISRRVGVLDLNYYEVFKKEQQTYLLSKISNMLFTWESYYFKKLIIDGKAYRITKFKNRNFKLMFGRSHKTLLITKGVFLRKKKKIKKKFMFFGSSLSNVSSAALMSKNIRPNDMYTDRGIRFSKDCNKRKLGKKGSSSFI